MWARSILKPQTIMKINFRTLKRKAPSIIGTNDYRFPEERQLARNELRELLNIKEFEALQLMSNEKLLHTVTHLIKHNYDVCIKNGLSKNTLLKHSFLLCEEKLDRKIEKLRKLPIELSCSIPLARLSMQRLNFIAINSTESMEKIQDLCTIFGLTPAKACEILSLKQFLFTLPLNDLQNLLNVLYEYGFTEEDILKDLWIFRYSEQCVRNRLDFVREHNISYLKTWMIRCPEDTLYKHIKRKSEDRDILGEHSVAEHLSEKLNCSESVAKSLIKKHPQLQTKSLLKINIMIDLLHKFGFTSVHICRIPKILLHSVDTTKQRLEQLKKLGTKLDSLYMLTKSQKQYQHYIENVLKLKVKAENTA